MKPTQLKNDILEHIKMCNNTESKRGSVISERMISKYPKLSEREIYLAITSLVKSKKIKQYETSPTQMIDGNLIENYYKYYDIQ